MSTRHIELQRLFEQARAMPADERTAWLRRECADDEQLRVDLLALLHADADTCLLDHDPAAAFAASPANDAPPPRVDNYRIVDRIASGGMGDVYRAHQLAPVQRTVALKVLRTGLADAAFRRRFEDERQLVARMQHTGIAQLFESGVTEDGCPFFAMELVEGLPITHFCEHHRMHLRERLELFASVCETVHYAHQQGVVHRDIKPGNVLVKEQDGRPIAKVIDFGIAHSDGLQARPDAILGTPGYVSPERLKGEADTPGSDTYALGVLLRELLVGFAPSTDAKPVPNCSETLQTAGDAETIAQTRRCSVAQLQRELRRDLDWIVGRATAALPNERYDTALALADDVRRYLAFLPTRAHPPQLPYRLSRCWRRHRTILMAAAFVLVGLLIAGSIGLAGWLDRKQARDSVDEASRVLFERSVDATLANLPGSDPARIKLLRSGLQLSNLALAEEPDNPELQRRVLLARAAWATLMVDLGRLDEAEATLRQLLADDIGNVARAERVSAHLRLVSVLRRSGQLDAAEAAVRDLTAHFPVREQDPWRVRALGASAWREQALNARRRNRPAEALRFARRALALIEDPPADIDPWLLRWKRIDIHKIVGELAAAVPEEPYEEHFVRALENLQALRREHQRAKLDHLVALIHDSWAYANVQRGHYETVAEHDALALAAIAPLLTSFPARVPYQETWLRVHRRRARILTQQGDEQAAATTYDEALARAVMWLKAAPDNPDLSRLVDLLRREREKLPR